MNRKTSAACGVLLASVLALSACNSMRTNTGMATGTAMMMTQLSGANEVPPVATSGAGSVETSYNRDTFMLRWTVTYCGLSGPATGGHLHGPAMPGQNAPVVVPFTGSLASPISGGQILTPAQASDLLAGKWYVNLHTQANPGGEIRGQLVVNR